MRVITRILRNILSDNFPIGKFVSCRRFYGTDIKSDSPIAENTKILKVAFIGSPNAGKSTLVNQIVKRRVLAISKKVHTTKVCARAIMNHENQQIVFLDTPGLVTSKQTERYNLANSFLKDGEDAIVEADLIAVVHDISNSVFRFKLDPKVLRLLHIFKHKESLLILNKVDTLKSKSLLLEISSKLTGNKIADNNIDNKILNNPISEIEIQNIVKNQHNWENFSNVFMVSALLNRGIEDLKNHLLSKTYPGKWIFPPETFTDQDPVVIIQNAVRSKLLEYLPEEIPYNVEVELEYLDMDKEEIISAVVLIHCNKERLVGLIKGIKGARIRMIANEAEQAIADAFFTDVNLKLIIAEKPQKSKYKNSSKIL